ncbi:hypothetical protein AMTRI_Chr04g180050 [Amborella trichopoda]
MSSINTTSTTAINGPNSLIYPLALITAVLFLYKAILNHRRRPRLNLLPGPKPWPIIGNLDLIGPLPHQSIHGLSKRYGPLMQLKFGSYPVVVASSVEMAKSILKTNDKVFATRPKMAAGKYTTYDYSDITWAPYGPYWRQARKMCILELKEELGAMLRGLCHLQGRPVVLKNELSTLSLNVMSRMVLDKKSLEVDESGNAIVKPEEFKKMLDELFLLSDVLLIGDQIPWLSFLDLEGYIKRMKAVSKKFDRFLEHVLDEHQNARKVEGFVAKDMVDVLLQVAEDPNLEVKLTRNNVKAFTQDMIAGGTESPAMIVEWAISELLRRPEIFERATQELDQVIGRTRWVDEKDMHQLPYVAGIVKETMRLHPVAPMLVPREALNVWTIGRDPKIWDSPDEFRPERFLRSPIHVKGQDFELLPFGSGRRMCPGYNLGLKVIQASLANLVHGFEWGLPEGMKKEDLNMAEIFGLSTPRKEPLVAVMKPRLTPQLYEQLH